MHFRRASSADRDQILGLRRRSFADAEPEKLDPRFWDWEFARASISVGAEEGGIVTHIAMLDLPYRVDGGIVRGALAVDAMSDPDARGRGAFSGVARFALGQQAYPVATAYQIRKPVLGAMLRAGWMEAERVPVLVRPALSFAKETHARDLTRSDLPWMSQVARHDGCVARTEEFLSWRFFENPLWHYRVRGLGGTAYIVTRRTTLKGFDTLAVVDLAALQPQDTRTLLRRAIAEARSQGCSLVAALVSRRHPSFGTFLRAGFLPGPHWFRLLVHPREHATRPWRVMWADTDHV